MKTYLVQLNYNANEAHRISATLLEFNIQSIDIDKAILMATKKLRYVMLNEDDYDVINLSEGYAELSFGDADTGQDVIYIITEMMIR